jgi:hypothetical protein
MGSLSGCHGRAKRARGGCAKTWIVDGGCPCMKAMAPGFAVYCRANRPWFRPQRQKRGLPTLIGFGDSPAC